MKISPDLLAVLACPNDQAELTYSAIEHTLNCSQCAADFEIREGIPVFVRQEDPGSRPA